MLPFLILAYDLSYASAAALVFASSVVSSVIQPLFGHLGDKVDRPWFMGVGIIMAGAGISVMGFLDSYWLIFAAAALTGVGVALFHPEGGKLANVVAGNKKGAGLSNFAVGGNIGFAVGPLIATFALGVWGIKGTVVFMIPALIMAALLFTQNAAYSRMSAQEIERKKQGSVGGTQTGDDWLGFWKVTSVNFARSIIGNGMLVFVPLYWVAVLAQTPEFGSLMLSLYAISGAVATFFGGRIADRIGFKRMILLCTSVMAPLLLLFIFTSNIVLATILVLLISLSLSGAYSPIVALAQQCLPNRVGLASGISLGVVVSVGGMASPGIGYIGDQFGLTASMVVICAVAFVGLVLALLLQRQGAGK
jgi:FSR family fosmidomycin resistance protein-like MFS transporter